MANVQRKLAVVDGGPLDLPITSMWQKFEDGYKRHPNGPAVISTHQSADHLMSVVGKEGPCEDKCLIWTYREMRRGASRIAESLQDHGIKKGSIMVTMLPNSAEWSLSFWVAALLQLTLVPLDPSLLDPTRAESLRYFLRLLKPSSVFILSEDQIKAFDDSHTTLSHTVTVKVVCQSTPTLPSKWTSLSALAEAGKTSGDSVNITQDPVIERNGSRLAAVLFTSGTSTGNPKGCPLTVSNLTAATASKDRFMNMDPDTRIILHNVNFRGIHVFTSVCIWNIGATVILAGANFSPTASLEAAEAHGGTWMMCVPAQLRAFQGDPTLSARNLSSLKFVALAGDIISQDLIEDTKEIFPQSRVLNIFGMTEGIGSAGWEPDCDISQAPTFAHSVPIGKVLPGIIIKVCDLQKQPLPRNEIGELHVCGGNMISRYYAGEQSELFYQAEGKDWIITGDRAMINDEGYIFVLGRSKDVIKKSGIPLSPTLIEAFVAKTNGIQAQAFGIPDKTYGEEPFVVISNPDPLIAESVSQSVAGGLGKDYTLKGVLSLFHLGFQSFPTNPSGKIMKAQLRDAVIAYLSSPENPR